MYVKHHLFLLNDMILTNIEARARDSARFIGDKSCGLPIARLGAVVSYRKSRVSKGFPSRRVESQTTNQYQFLERIHRRWHELHCRCVAI